MLLYYCLPKLSKFLSVDKPLTHAPLLRMGKNQTTPLYSDTAKRKHFLTIKKL